MKKLLVSLVFILFFVACSSQPTPHYSLDQPSYKLQNENLITQKLYRSYRKWQGVPYCYGGESKECIDCSAFVQKIYKEAFDIKLPRTTKEQLKVGLLIPKKELKEGDLLFFRTSYKGLHTGIYLENGNFIHASSSYGVKVSSIKNSYWKSHYYQARRILF